MKKERAIGL